MIQDWSRGLPRVIHATTGNLHTSHELSQIIEEVRRNTSRFIFLSGGASNMAEDTGLALLDTLRGLADLSDRGCAIAVGDGGTKAGIMEAAGTARVAARHPFPLIGVAPAPEITLTDEPGKTPIEPRHSHIVAVWNPAWEEQRRREGWTPAAGYWGSETDAMFEIFARLCNGDPSAAVIANGGSVTLQEIRGHLDANRRMLVLSGSGRAADAVISLIAGTTPRDADVVELRRTAERIGLPSRPDLYTTLDVGAGAAALADTLAKMLEDDSTPR